MLQSDQNDPLDMPVFRFGTFEMGEVGFGEEFRERSF
jgi:hypothetical protein